MDNEQGCVLTQDAFGYWSCSRCDLRWLMFEVEKDDLRYCPKCGARVMDIEEETDA